MTNTTGANPGVDIGFNAFDQLTAPVLPAMYGTMEAVCILA
jgi:hypothetical protein